MRQDSAFHRFRRLVSAVPLRAWIVLFALLGGVAGLGFFAFTYAEGFSYLSDDPRACANCHVMRAVYDGWNQGSHKAVAVCNDCHTPHSTLVAKYTIKALNGWRHSKAFTLNEIPDPILIVSSDREIAYENCLGCHGDMTVAISHVDSSTPTDCIQCHWEVGHRD